MKKLIAINDKNLKYEIETRIKVDSLRQLVFLRSMIRISSMRLKRPSHDDISEATTQLDQ